jgi:predicted Zn-dependent protease
MVFKRVVFLYILFSLPIYSFEFRKRINQDPNIYSADDIRAEVKFGETMASKMLSKYPLSENKVWQRYVNAIGASLAATIGRAELKYYFAVIESEDKNAYAIPGGFVFITSSLMKSMTNESQLVGVIAHEIGHINHRHIVKKLNIRGQYSMMALSSSLIGGNTQSFRTLMKVALNQGMKILFEDGYGKRAELEADATSYYSLVNNNYAVSEYSILLKDLYQDLENVKVLNKTHPPAKKRIHYLNKLLIRDKIESTFGKTNEKRFSKYFNSFRS